jgi:hypothetical protein
VIAVNFLMTHHGFPSPAAPWQRLAASAPLAGIHDRPSFYERIWNERLDALWVLLRHPEKE